MITKVTLTMDDGSVHDFLSMDDAVAHASSAMIVPLATPESHEENTVVAETGEENTAVAEGEATAEAEPHEEV